MACTSLVYMLQRRHSHEPTLHLGRCCQVCGLDPSPLNNHHSGAENKKGQNKALPIMTCQSWRTRCIVSHEAYSERIVLDLSWLAMVPKEFRRTFSGSILII